jgi:hypothetical protein
MDAPLSSDEFTEVDFVLPPKSQNPQTPTVPPKEVIKCSNATAIQLILEDKEASECVEWAKKDNRWRLFLGDIQPIDHALSTAKHIVDSWETACASRAKWGNIEIPTLDSDDPITVGKLHAYLSEILATHPDFAAVPIRHHECHSVVETTVVEFDIEGGFLGFN